MAALDRGLSYGGTGAAMGSVAGPYGAAIGGGLGLLYGLFSSDPEAEAEERKRAALAAAQAQYSAYRPQVMGAQLNATNQQLGAYSGVSNALNAMYGPGMQTAPANAPVAKAIFPQGPAKDLSGWYGRR